MKKGYLPKGRKGNSGNTKRKGKGKGYKPKNSRPSRG
jgi:hypothetical protein